MALARNLNNLVKYGVTDSGEALGYITHTLADPERVASGKQLPFRYFAALKALKAEGAVGRALRKALAAALELSFANMPELGRSVLVANDISGSMSARPSPRSEMTMAEIAGIFAAAVYKKAESGEIVSFDTTAHPRDVPKDLLLATIAERISGHGGGTSLSAPLEYAFKDRTRAVDTAVFLTDSESWYDHLTRHRGVLDEIRDYRQRASPQLKCFFVQLVPYKHAVVPETEPGCYYLYGWSGAVLGYIASVVSGGESQVEAVKQVSVL
jgi:60 kDa SS-A/Ro ribonucleoprotein